MTQAIHVSCKLDEVSSVCVFFTMTDMRICRKAIDVNTVTSETKKKDVRRMPNEKAIVKMN